MERAPRDEPERSFEAIRAAAARIERFVRRTPVLSDRLVDDMVSVSEEAIAAAARLVLERLKVLIEPSAAVPVAALLERKVDASGARIGIILSGGNLDLDAASWLTGVR